MPGSRAQVTGVLFAMVTTERALPGPCCGEVTIAAPPPGAHAGPVSYGPLLNAAAIVLTAHANVPPEKAAQVIGMLPGVEVSAGQDGEDEAGPGEEGKAPAGAPHVLAVRTLDGRLVRLRAPWRRAARATSPGASSRGSGASS